MKQAGGVGKWDIEDIQQVPYLALYLIFIPFVLVPCTVHVSYFFEHGNSLLGIRFECFNFPTDAS